MSRQGSPFDEIVERMNRQLEQAARSWGTGGVLSRMNVDVADRDDEYVVTADVPGYDRDDIQVSIDDRMLHVKATREESAEAGEEQYIRRERRRGTVRESVTLPGPVEEEDASATYTNGVLTVRLPKLGDVEGGRSIDVE